MKSIYKTLTGILCLAALSQGMVSCTDAGSELVSFEEDNRLSSPNDTVYSLLGIIGKMQVIADRTVLLGELRGDLTSLTADATLDLQAIANFEADASNPYNNARDYYAVIQNCNYFLANADTALTIRGRKVFEKEYAVIKTYRAWTYLQLALNYGAVPFITEPLLAEKDADPSLYPFYDVEQIAEYFINDLKPYMDTEYPDYGIMGNFATRTFYYPTRVLIGDLCLWAGRYREAAQHYHDFLTREGNQRPIGASYTVEWNGHEFENILDFYTSSFVSTSECLTTIPMMTSEYDGIISNLRDVFCSTDKNRYYYQATHSAAYDELSQSQHYTLVYNDPVTMLPDTISPDYDALNKENSLRGDLRQMSVYYLRSATSASSDYSKLYQTCYKYSYADEVHILRLRHIYLRYAEALNRAGLPESAFAVLKHGLFHETLSTEKNYISRDEQERAGDLIQFSEYYFTRGNTIGIHSYGSGRADADKTYVIPELPTREDSILFVEDKICDEMALETAAEGLRYYDLMRLALHRDDPTYLADKVARRNGTANIDQNLFTKLSDKKNWYLPLE
ncbi:MAG: hypothetical protein J1F40_06155 [Prevotellaceae bacterium]|nr:hypothetical protein [Prevotellaceae bacterium]